MFLTLLINVHNSHILFSYSWNYVDLFILGVVVAEWRPGEIHEAGDIVLLRPFTCLGPFLADKMSPWLFCSSIYKNSIIQFQKKEIILTHKNTILITKNKRTKNKGLEICETFSNPKKIESMRIEWALGNYQVLSRTRPQRLVFPPETNSWWYTWLYPLPISGTKYIHIL